MIKKFLVTVGLITGMVGVLAGCGGVTGQSTTSEKTVDQLAMPKKEETIATISVKNYGDIKVRFFEEQAPKAVENFVTHAKEGYYDGVTFHRVINDFMIQGGDPEGTGMGGESIWGTAFEDEFSEDLLPIRGALCMANAGANTNGSQFFIVQAKTVEDGMFSSNISYTEEQIKKFKENGGTPWLKGQHTVFGQVYEGMDVVDEIAQTSVDESSAPKKPVVIDHITIEQYKG